jgi:hypothetical protein
MPRPSEIRCLLSPRQDLYHASLVFTGLRELDRQGLTRVRFDIASGSCSDVVDPVTLRLDVSDPESGFCRLAIDLSDHADRLCIPALEQCDRYLKRSLYHPSLPPLPQALLAKIHPFGLNYACRSRSSAVQVLSQCAFRGMRQLKKGPRRLAAHAVEFRHVLKSYLLSPAPEEFEWSPDAPVEPTVLFQTRVWEPEEVYPDDPDEINSTRVAIVRALRSAFGSQFQGGLVPTGYAQEHYPDAVAVNPCRRGQFIAWSKQSLIGVYTRGLHHSTAFKLPEYLAASKCIVSEVPRNELPAPLVAGQHYLSFASPEECVELCRQLLADAARSRQLRQEAWSYYQRYGRPDVLVRGHIAGFVPSHGLAPATSTAH